jgi:2-iminobutanoate/2-iminopropanoate deaminase
MTSAAESERACFDFPGPKRPGFSEIVRAGPWIMVSGQVPTVEGRLVGAGDPEAQVRQVFANLKAALEMAGSGLADVVKLTCFLTDRSAFPAYAAVKRELFVDKPPAGTAVLVSGLFAEGALLEVEATAYSPTRPA